jgi:hypothetical protein
MSRRASSGMHPGVILGAVVVIVALFFGGKALLVKKPGGFSNVTPLPISDMLANGNSLRGNEYSVEGTVSERWAKSSGQVVSVRVKTDTGTEIIGIMVPKSVPGNVERELKYAFKVRIEQGGVPVATEVKAL